MKRCEVMGRVHRDPEELTEALARIDDQLTRLRYVESAFPVLFPPSTYPVPEAVGDAWNAVSDAIDRLERERVDVEVNPEPIPLSEAENYRLVKDNVD